MSREKIRQHFMHALLERFHERDGERSAELNAGRARHEQILQRALARIDREEAAPALPSTWSRSSSWISALAAAAVVLWFALGPGTPTSAAAIVEHAIRAHREPVDRQYRVTRSGGPIGRSREATLYVRGSERFASLIKLDDGELWTGFDGAEAWLVPARRHLPVWIHGERSLIGSWLQERDSELPFLELDSVLSVLPDGYTLERVDEDPFDAPAQGRFTYLIATRGPDVEFGPRRVELRADAETGAIDRLLLHGNLVGRSVHVEFERIGDEPYPDAWYGHAAHHDPSRVVIDPGR